LYLRLTQRVKSGARLFIVLRTLPVLTTGPDTLRLVLHGVVERAHHLPSGGCDLRVSIIDCQAL